VTGIEAPPLEQLHTRKSAKWRSHPHDVLPLPVAEMDFPIAPPVAEVLRNMINRSDTGYGGIVPELGEAFASYSLTHWNWQVDPSHLRLATDVGVAGVELLRVLAPPGSTLVINTPVYHNFMTWAAEAKYTVADVPLHYSGNGVWDLDFAGLERAFAAGAAAYLLCNPHNPVGTVFCEEHLARVAALADHYGVVVISDEIHAPLNYTSTPFVPYLKVNDAARRTGVCITSASKSWNLAGLKCAQIVTADEEMRQRLDALPLSLPWRASILGAWASVAAYREGQPWLDDVMHTLASNREYLATRIPEVLPRAVYHRPESTYLAWIDLRNYGLEDPGTVLLEKGRVALNEGKDFGPDGVGFVRLNFAANQSTLDEALHRMASVLEA
jgi:cystathionine beta-lyase